MGAPSWAGTGPPGKGGSKSSGKGSSKGGAKGAGAKGGSYWIPKSDPAAGAADGGKGKYKDEDAGKGKGKGKGKAHWVPKFPLDQAEVAGKATGKGKDNHGGKAHWIPKRRASMFSTTSTLEMVQIAEDLGGKIVSLDSRSGLIGKLECVLFGLHVDSSAGDTESTGVVVCLQGLPHSAETMREWRSAAQRAGWLRLGTIVAVPNMQMSSAVRPEDVAAVIDATLERVGSDRCVLAAKDLVAPCAIEAIMAEETQSIVTGLVLVAPTSPAPAVCSEIAIPVLLLWAQDDDVCAFDERIGWLSALDDRQGPTTVKECDSGKHRLDEMLGDRDTAEAVRLFVVSALLLAELCIERDEDDASEDFTQRRVRKLTDELPEFIKQASLHSHPDENEADSRKPEEELTARRLSQDLPSWLQSGLVQASE